MASNPVRTCVGCRRRAPATDLVRVSVVAGEMLVGAVGSGRGAWCCPHDDCLERALRKGGLVRALRTAPDRINADMLRRAFRNHGQA